MFSQRQESTRVLAALGCGLARDQKSVSELIQLTGDSSIKVAQAAVFSLAVIGTRQALDGVAQILLEGTEELRRAAAEALAFLPEEGHPTLKEGSTHEDLLVRRAVVYGLARVNEPWALETLQQMQIEDGQWVVRSAATQSIEELQKREVYYPQNLPQPQDAAWLLAFASKQGLGVLPGKPAFNLILQALKSEDIYEVFAALAYLERTPDAGGVSGIYGVMYGSGGEVKEAAYHSHYQLAGAGVELPSPAQFGLG
jgi:HEAT repeat protein